MPNLQFGIIMTVMGMGGTLIILFLIGLVVDALNKILLRDAKNGEERG
jgi:Na+-transporting methylmalonyl-CoA/oxaloacetate decarboxylase gamma subunit